MIDFREITLEDRARIREMICASGCLGADYNYANLYIWREVYGPRIAFMDNRLLVFMPDRDLYAYPKGSGDVGPIINLMAEDAKERGIRLVIRGLTDKTLEEFMPLYGDRFEIIEDRDNADYMYEIDRLRTLSGRKLASKRNHIKHFERNGEWEVRLIGGGAAIATDSDGKPIATCTMDEAKAFIDIYSAAKNDPELDDEQLALTEMFSHYDELGFIGLLLIQGGEAVAFTAGTMLGADVFDVHFEKALPHAEGAYAMINREFANLISQLIPEVRYFNREEDLGLEGLRRAKLSYHPDILMMKYIARAR